MSKTRAAPVYIVGNSRSGTTILSIGLGKHTKIFNFREIHFFEKYWTSDQNKNTYTRKEALAIAEKLIGGQKEGFLYCKNPEAYNKEALQLLSRLKETENINSEDLYSEFLYSETERSGKSIPCEQTPHNVSYLDNIFRIFPDARIIAMIRDPRDVLLSQKNKSKMKRAGNNTIPLKERMRTWANYHPYIMSLMWNKVAKEIDRWKNDERLIVIKFEDLIGNPELTLRNISEFIGVSYESTVLDVPQTGSSNISDDTSKKGINKEVMGKWKKGLSSAEAAICQKINKQEIHNYNYEWEDINSNIISKGLIAAALPFKGVMAVALNIGRSNNIFRSIMKRLADVPGL